MRTNSTLFKQYERLYLHFQKHLHKNVSDVSLQTDPFELIVHTTKEDVALALYVSPRHIQTLFEKLHANGAIDWYPTRGRGNRSKLVFKRPLIYYYQQYIETLVYDRSFVELFSYAKKENINLNALFLDAFGLKRSAQEERSETLWTLELPYFESSLPKQLDFKRNSQQMETPFIRGLKQLVFEPLFFYEERLQGEQIVQSIFLRQWKMEHPRHWRFYLRSRVLFHHGKAVDTANIIETLESLQQHYSFFSFIDRIVATTDKIIDLYLLKPALELPELIALFSPLVMEEEGEKFYGTGPYEITIEQTQGKSEGPQKTLMFKRFERYAGLRPEVAQIKFHYYSQQWQSLFPIECNQDPMAAFDARGEPLHMSQGNESPLNQNQRFLNTQMSEQNQLQIPSLENCYGIWFNLNHDDFSPQKSENSALLQLLIHELRPEWFLLELFNNGSSYAPLLDIAHSLKRGRRDDAVLQRERLQQPFLLKDKMIEKAPLILKIGFWKEDPFSQLLVELIQQKLDENGINLQLIPLDPLTGLSHNIHMMLHHHMGLSNSSDLYRLLTSFESWMEPSLHYDFLQKTKAEHYITPNTEQLNRLWEWQVDAINRSQLRPLFHLQQRKSTLKDQLYYSDLFWEA